MSGSQSRSESGELSFPGYCVHTLGYNVQTKTEQWIENKGEMQRGE
jgi:hypothetical protein